MKSGQRTQTYVKSRQLRYDLECIEKEDCTIGQYLVVFGKLQTFFNRLEIKFRTAIDTIFDRLPTEYQALTSIIQYRDDPCLMIVVETMLLSH